MFCCMSSRDVHAEIIESMDMSSCINTLRRFFAQRGPAKQLRSYCGTNFIGACKELGMDKTLQTLNNNSYFHWHCSLHKRQEFCLLLETFRIRTCTQRNGDKFRLLQTSSKPAGAVNTYLACNTDKSGQYLAETFKWEI